MEMFLSKISSYNIFNNLLPGVILIVICEKILSIKLANENMIVFLFMSYFCGMIIGRIGSLIIEPLLKRTNFIKHANYKDCVTASKVDSKLDYLIEGNNTYRSFISLFVTIVMIKLYLTLSHQLQWLMEYFEIIILLVLMILFIFSYKKQTQYINPRINIFKNVGGEK